MGETPRSLYLYMNVDGMWDSAKQGACGGMARDHNGGWICDFQRTLGFF